MFDSATFWSIAYQPPLSMRFTRKEYWNWLLWPPPGDLPNPGIEPVSPMSPALAGRFFTTSTTIHIGLNYYGQPLTTLTSESLVGVSDTPQAPVNSPFIKLLIKRMP